MNWEFAILDVIYHCHTPWCDALMVFISTLGNKGFIWIALSLGLFLNKKYRRIGLTMLLALALGVLVGNLTLKPLIARIRPFDANALITLLITPPADFSFPSGHTLSSFAAATGLFYHNRLWGSIAYFFAALMGFSRLYLYVHYPTDVFGGIIIGILIGTIAAILIKHYEKRRSKIPQ